ncbi:MAG TPA: lysylphosphatidylglycerol synthase domain-containing protein [Acidimicrobiales bacterium]
MDRATDAHPAAPPPADTSPGIHAAAAQAGDARPAAEGDGPGAAPGPPPGAASGEGGAARHAGSDTGVRPGGAGSGGAAGALRRLASAGAVRRLAAAARSARELANRPRVRPWLFAATALVFVALAVTSFRSLPDEGRSARPEVVAVLVLVTTPLTLLLNAFEYRFMASRLGHRVGMRPAMKVSLIASIANYLPAPGGIAVRTAALKREGSTVRSAVSINAVAGLVWLGATGLIGGGSMLLDDRLVGRGVAATVAGTVAMVGSVVWLRRGGGRWAPMFWQILGIEVAVVLVSGARVWLSLAAIGQATDFGAAIAISSATVFAALFGIFPAGLGLRELIAGGIATAVAVPAASAVAASAVDRIASQVGMALTAVVVGVRRKDLTAPADEPEDPDTATSG